MDKKRLIKLLKIILPLALGIFLVIYSYMTTSQEDKETIYRYIKEANYFWVAISLVMGVLSHWSRAYRWSYLLEPMGYKPKMFNNFMAVSIGYFANLGIPRSGEVLRATTVAGYENIPFEKAFGTIVAERIIDFIMLVLIVGIALILQTASIVEILNERGFSFKSLLIAAVIGVIGIVIFIRFIKNAKHPFALKLKTFINGLLEGVVSIFKMKKKWAFLFHTFFIWSMYVFMFWIIKFSISEDVYLEFGVVLVGFIAGAFAMSASNGGIGWFPIAVTTAFAAFGISEAYGEAFGWIMWISQTLLVAFLGILSFLLLPFYNRNR